MAAHKQGGALVIPLSLVTLLALKLLPTGRRALTSTDFSKDNAWYRQRLGELLAWRAAGKLTPIVANRIPLLEAVRAHELLERGRYAGKVVLIA